jgi:hypothetical protein
MMIMSRYTSINSRFVVLSIVQLQALMFRKIRALRECCRIRSFSQQREFKLLLFCGSREVERVVTATFGRFMSLLGSF